MLDGENSDRNKNNDRLNVTSQACIQAGGAQPLDVNEVVVPQ